MAERAGRLRVSPRARLIVALAAVPAALLAVNGVAYLLQGQMTPPDCPPGTGVDQSMCEQSDACGLGCEQGATSGADPRCQWRQVTNNCGGAQSCTTVPTTAPLGGACGGVECCLTSEKTFNGQAVTCSEKITRPRSCDEGICSSYDMTCRLTCEEVRKNAPQNTSACEPVSCLWDTGNGYTTIVVSCGEGLQCCPSNTQYGNTCRPVGQYCGPVNPDDDGDNDEGGGGGASGGGVSGTTSGDGGSGATGGDGGDTGGTGHSSSGPGDPGCDGGTCPSSGPVPDPTPSSPSGGGCMAICPTGVTMVCEPDSCNCSCVYSRTCDAADERIACVRQKLSISSAEAVFGNNADGSRVFALKQTRTRQAILSALEDCGLEYLRPGNFTNSAILAALSPQDIMSGDVSNAAYVDGACSVQKIAEYQAAGIAVSVDTNCNFPHLGYNNARRSSASSTLIMVGIADEGDSFYVAGVCRPDASSSSLSRRSAAASSTASSRRSSSASSRASSRTSAAAASSASRISSVPHASSVSARSSAQPSSRSASAGVSSAVNAASSLSSAASNAAPSSAAVQSSAALATSSRSSAQQIAAASSAPPSSRSSGRPSSHAAARLSSAASSEPLHTVSSVPRAYCCVDNRCTFGVTCANPRTYAECRLECVPPAAPGGSARSAAASSAVTIVGSLCAPDSCALGGNDFCSWSGKTCELTAGLPCIRCVAAAPSSSASSATPFSAPATPTPRSSAPRVALDTPPVYIGDAPAAPRRCDCAANERCVDDVCLTLVQVAQLPPFCGNARVDAGETCDDGSENADAPNALCRPDCTPARCGDGVLDTPLELCDDGNALPGDGCTALCQIERAAPVEQEPTQTLPAQIIELPFQRPEQIAQQPYEPVYQQPAYVAPPAPRPPAQADTGPAALAVMVAGGAAGYGWMRRRGN